ncbi:MAG: acyl carrier protein [Pseudomonadota bacterium]
MTRTDMERQIRTILTRVTHKDVAHISLDDDLIDAIGIDSLGRLEVLSEVEEAFDVTIYDLDADKISTIRGILGVVDAAMLEPV